jgi:thymidylate synthase ThyX
MSNQRDQNVLVLNGTDIGDPEILAMLQAFYSRSPMPIEERLCSLNGDDKELKEDKIRAALKRYYIGFGHASIADCGGATVFVENISMIAAKVIQDDPLYNGQECSTRYLDFAKQPFLTAHGSEEEVRIQETWRSLYQEYLPKLVEWAQANYGYEVVSDKVPEDKVHETWISTCKAIAFDVARGLLPCGTSTNVAWTGTLRRLGDRCKEMAQHPLKEVREIAKNVHAALYAKHPNSFKPTLDCSGDNVQYTMYSSDFADSSVLAEAPIIRSSWMPEDIPIDQFAGVLKCVTNGLMHEKAAANLMYFNLGGQIDFGSFRDLQRHRNGLNQLPLVGYWGSTKAVSLNNYYTHILEKVDPALFKGVKLLVAQLTSVQVSKEGLQYVLPMMANVPVRLHWNLGQMRYVLSLRSKTSVHPTLRTWVQSLWTRLLIEETRVGLPAGTLCDFCLINRDHHYWASDRGNQTIQERR